MEQEFLIQSKAAMFASQPIRMPTQQHESFSIGVNNEDINSITIDVDKKEYGSSIKSLSGLEEYNSQLEQRQAITLNGSPEQTMKNRFFHANTIGT